MQRVELSCHTGYSKMDGIGLGEEWAKFAAHNNIKTFVITDKGNIEGFEDFYNSFKKYSPDTKLIMGADICVFDDRDWMCGYTKEFGRLTLLVKNEIGIRNLRHILREGEQKYKKESDIEAVMPLVELVLENREGLLIGVSLVQKDGRSFPLDLDYLEIPCYELSEDEVYEYIAMADKLNLPLVATCMPAYPFPKYKDLYRLLKNELSIHDRHYHITEEMMDIFSFLGRKLAYKIVVENSNAIATECESVHM